MVGIWKASRMYLSADLWLYRKQGNFIFQQLLSTRSWLPATPTLPFPPGRELLPPETLTGGGAEEVGPQLGPPGLGGLPHTEWTALGPVGWRHCRCTACPAPHVAAGSLCGTEGLSPEPEDWSDDPPAGHQGRATGHPAVGSPEPDTWLWTQTVRCPPPPGPRSWEELWHQQQDKSHTGSQQQEVIHCNHLLGPAHSGYMDQLSRIE